MSEALLDGLPTCSVSLFESSALISALARRSVTCSS